MKLLIANRGEIAIRVMRAAAELGITTVAVAPEDDAGSLHTGKADEFVSLEGIGAAAYLDIQQLVEVAKQTECDAVHPGYGFLSENADFAEQCEAAGITYVGPTVESLRLFGDKARARAAAVEADVPIIRGIDHAVSVEEAQTFFDTLGPDGSMMIKAIGGGGGRGSRAVTQSSDVAPSFERCEAEALAAFGNGNLYVEEYISQARHVEVQILGDGSGAVAHLHERECSAQRRFQKLVEIAPAPGLDESLRASILEAAVRFASHVNYRNAGTFEFLVNEQAGSGAFAFIETNARLQVEHTVSEEVTGVDIVKAQLRLSQGSTLEELGLVESIPCRGYAIQARVCMESVAADGTVRPSSGVLSAYEPPSGLGIRTDGFGYGGYETSLNFDSLLAKVIGYSPSKDFADAITRTSRALSEFRIEGVETNIGLLQNILNHADFATGAIHTRFVDGNLETLTNSDDHTFFSLPANYEPNLTEGGFAGARVEDARDPLALFDHDQRTKAEEAEAEQVAQAEPISVVSPFPGKVSALLVSKGERVASNQALVTVYALELDNQLVAPSNGTVDSIEIAEGDSVKQDTVLVRLIPDEDSDQLETVTITSVVAKPSKPVTKPTVPSVSKSLRNELQEVLDRRFYVDDEFRSEKIARRHAKGQRSPQENIDHLMDGTFREYGPLVTAASWQKQQWLRETTQADGLVMGIGHINGDLFDDDRSRSIAVHYDYMVVAGTQGGRGHYKQDRIYELAERYHLPLILFAEGGGGRPGISGGERAEPVDLAIESGLRQPGQAPRKSRSSAVDVAGRGGGGVPVDSYTFTKLCQLSGLVPLVGVNSGRCFAGNTVMLASCDVIIAAANSTIGLGGPAMIEGGGLGIYTPEEVGPMSFQVPNGVVDILVEDDEAAIECTKKYLSYFQGSISQWSAADQTRLRTLVPEDRNVQYDMRELIQVLVDENSVLEIREQFGIGIITAFVRIEGHPLGLIANNPKHLAGAIDSDAADKAARFLQLCDAFEIPVLSLIDCPGVMMGPSHEQNGLLRHVSRLLVTSANMTTPFFSVVIRRAHGSGARAMCGGSSLEPFFTVSWPTGEFAETTLSSHVNLQYGEELDLIESKEERQTVYDRLLSAYIERARAVNAGGTNYGIDDVIDPFDTRSWIAQGLGSVPQKPHLLEKKRPNIDTW